MSVANHSKIVLGAAEQEERALNIRNRDDPASQQRGSLMPLDEALEKLTALKKERVLKAEL